MLIQEDWVFQVNNIKSTVSQCRTWKGLLNFTTFICPHQFPCWFIFPTLHIKVTTHVWIYMLQQYDMGFRGIDFS